MSPYQIGFGRDRNLGGIPKKRFDEAEAAVGFLDRMRTLDEEVANILNDFHNK